MSRASRKLEHMKLALEIGQSDTHDFQNVHFVHQALPEVSFDETSINSTIGELHLGSPIIINAMTGGAHETTKINEQLAIVARDTGVALAVGSQMSAIKNKEFIPSYQVVRKINPDGVIFANIGAEADIEQAKIAVEMIEANALQIHLNVIQELIMPEGDRDFRGTIERLQAINDAIDVPIIVKEVGFGISRETAKTLKEIGITIIDVGGKGGTSFARIENERRIKPLSLFDDWGISTAASILEVSKYENIEIIATGGIKDSLNIAKAIALGAKAIGLAGVVLNKLVTNGLDDTIEYIEEINQELRLIMTGLGVSNIMDLQRVPMVILRDLKDWCELRGIDISSIARRKL
ncbi:type 2 isopentenyl-diphosphate Delta-isomerase [Vulcanibacillus modesticaldus]|uniref:Isopentenyl-diphosphate delta-isomerase n=1 Tax=Vulcanibacillus modesticaldus TaxID=337097 RepID=A0A1D2YSI5_9BACI|nr:type 2 isopentenyl-diphosphate Delta-isomerase [Vulcanibacillus modesticaldus]OEF97284.1 type 2 isopentenyl-diphosphate Delta-isomerase [Vulcanibacillus modesticaldus]